MFSDYAIYLVIAVVILFFIYSSQSREMFDGVSPQGVSPMSLAGGVSPDPSDVPAFNAYQLMEQPSDPRYVWVPGVNGYLLPFNELDFSLPYHRWMYYYYPNYYQTYYDTVWPFNHPWPYDLYYGGSYGGDYGGDFYGYRGDYYRQRNNNYLPYNYRRDNRDTKYYPSRANMPLINTGSYPNHQTGFAGGQYSQRFSGFGSRGSGLRTGSHAPSFGGGRSGGGRSGGGHGGGRSHFTLVDSVDSAPNKCAGSYQNNICTSLIDPAIADRGGNAKGSKACETDNLMEKFGMTETVDGVFYSRDPHAYMEPVYGVLTFDVKPSDIKDVPGLQIEPSPLTDGSNWPTASGLPAYPMYPASENYPNPGYEVQRAISYTQQPARGYPTYPASENYLDSGYGVQRAISYDQQPLQGYGAMQGNLITKNNPLQGTPYYSQGNTEGSIEAPIYGQVTFGEQEYSPQNQDYFSYPTLNKGYLSDKTNLNYETEPEFVRNQQLIACEQEDDVEFCRQKYGTVSPGYSANIGTVDKSPVTM